MDNEIKGEGNSINFTYRMHDPRVGRFFAVDPLIVRYPMLSPYHFSHNSPIATKEIEGLEGDAKFLIQEAMKVAPKLGMATDEYIEMARPFAALPDATGMYLIRYGTPFEDIYGVFAGEDFEGNVYHRGEAGVWAVASFVPFAKLGKVAKPLAKVTVEATSKFKYIKSGYKVGGKYTDDFVRSADQVIEGIGAKKFNISSIDKISGKGKSLLNDAIERYHNVIEDIADSDVSAVIKELHGTEIMKNGKSYNHVKALSDRVKGLKNTLKELGEGFKNGSFSGGVLKEAKNLHNHITKEVERLGNVVDGALKSSGN